MKRSISWLLAMVVVVSLSGCVGGSFSKNTGASLEQTNPTGQEQPWRAVAAPAIPFNEVKTLMAILFPLDKADSAWIGEFGIIFMDEDGAVHLIRRDVWRAFVELNGKVNDVPYPALIDKFAKYLYALVPNVPKNELIGAQAGVLSGASTRVMQPNGAIVKLPAGEGENAKLMEKFFQANASRIESWQVVDLSPGTPAGDQFIANVKKRFPVLLKIGNQELRATTDVVDASEMTPQISMVDKIISHGSAPVSVMSVLSMTNPVLGSIQAAQIVYGLTRVATDKEMYGPYGETKYPGWVAGEVFGDYLKKCHKTMDTQEKEIKLLKRKLGQNHALSMDQ